MFHTCIYGTFLHVHIIGIVHIIGVVHIIGIVTFNKKSCSKLSIFGSLGLILVGTDQLYVVAKCDGT